jgi:hypothetical protein
MHTKFWSENVREGDHLDDLGVLRERIIYYEEIRCGGFRQV